MRALCERVRIAGDIRWQEAGYRHASYGHGFLICRIRPYRNQARPESGQTGIRSDRNQAIPESGVPANRHTGAYYDLYPDLAIPARRPCAHLTSASSAASLTSSRRPTPPASPREPARPTEAPPAPASVRLGPRGGPGWGGARPGAPAACHDTWRGERAWAGKSRQGAGDKSRACWRNGTREG